MLTRIQFQKKVRQNKNKFLLFGPYGFSSKQIKSDFSNLSRNLSSVFFFLSLIFSGDYGRVSMKFVSSFFVANGTILKKVGENQDPLTFEEVGQENGFMLYETGIDKLFTDPAKLEIAEIHDRAYIFVNKEPRGVLSRAENVKSMPLSVDVGDTLQILVENQGRIRAQCTIIIS